MFLSADCFLLFLYFFYRFKYIVTSHHLSSLYIYLYLHLSSLSNIYVHINSIIICLSSTIYPSIQLFFCYLCPSSVFLSFTQPIYQSSLLFYLFVVLLFVWVPRGKGRPLLIFLSRPLLICCSGPPLDRFLYRLCESKSLFSSMNKK